MTSPPRQTLPFAYLDPLTGQFRCERGWYKYFVDESSSISPAAGPDNAVQYGNAGVPAGSANFTYNAGANTVSFGNITGSDLSMVIRPRAPTVLENAGGVFVLAASAVKANGDGGSLGFISGSKLGTGRHGSLNFVISNTGVSLGLTAFGAALVGPDESGFEISSGQSTFNGGIGPGFAPTTQFILGVDDTFSDGGLLTFDGDSGPILQAQETPIGTPKMAFFGATLTAKPTVTGSRGGNAALASLLTALASLGLITNSTTA